MKLPIRQKYLEQIKAGTKPFEWRAAHLTLESIETGETLRVEVERCAVVRNEVAKSNSYGISQKEWDDMFEGEKIIQFVLKPLSSDLSSSTQG